MKNILLAAAVMLAALPLAHADEAKRTNLGTLSCDVSGGIGLVLGSSKKVSCSFQNADGSVDSYDGSLDKVGLDIGISGESVMKWVVFTPIGNEVGQNALAGRYVGVSTGVSLGIGLGANALVGGSEKKIGLQPISLEGKTGLNVAVGVASLTLNPA